MRLIGIIEQSSNYHNLMLSESDPTASHFFLQESECAGRGGEERQPRTRGLVGWLSGV